MYTSSNQLLNQGTHTLPFSLTHLDLMMELQQVDLFRNMELLLTLLGGGAATMMVLTINADMVLQWVLQWQLQETTTECQLV